MVLLFYNCFPPPPSQPVNPPFLYNPLEKRHMVMVYITFVRYSVAKDKRLSSYFSSLKENWKEKKEILPIWMAKPKMSVLFMPSEDMCRATAAYSSFPLLFTCQTWIIITRKMNRGLSPNRIKIDFDTHRPDEWTFHKRDLKRTRWDPSR